VGERETHSRKTMGSISLSCQTKLVLIDSETVFWIYIAPKNTLVQIGVWLVIKSVKTSYCFLFLCLVYLMRATVLSIH